MVAVEPGVGPMTPTLAGRMQTRMALLLFVGVPWTILVVPLSRLGLDVSLSDAYSVSFRALLATLVLGLLWELLYHGAQQYRWEKDWPTLFGLLNGVNEGIVVYLVLRAGLAPGGDVPVRMFVIHFATTWLAVWAVANGPIQILFPMWRFRGGRLV